MPLKHLTETILVVALALAVIVTGIVLSTLPPIPEGFFPWGGLFVATILYPALLYPLLKSNRADYSFRALHFAPVAMTIGWMIVEIAVLKAPQLHALRAVYAWGFSALAVTVIFLLIVWYCLLVIRRRVPRLTFLILLFVPFAALAYANERSLHLNSMLATALWKTSRPIEIAQQPVSSAPSSKGEKDLSHSSVPEEEAWRQKLRAVEEGKVHSSSSSLLADASVKGVTAVSELSQQKGVQTGKKSSSSRGHLPKAGGEFESLALFVIAAYAATVHMRARKMVA